MVYELFLFPNIAGAKGTFPKKGDGSEWEK